MPPRKHVAKGQGQASKHNDKTPVPQSRSNSSAPSVSDGTMDTATPQVPDRNDEVRKASGDSPKAENSIGLSPEEVGSMMERRNDTKSAPPNGKLESSAGPKPTNHHGDFSTEDSTPKLKDPRLRLLEDMHSLEKNMMGVVCRYEKIRKEYGERRGEVELLTELVVKCKKIEREKEQLRREADNRELDLQKMDAKLKYSEKQHSEAVGREQKIQSQLEKVEKKSEEAQQGWKEEKARFEKALKKTESLNSNKTSKDRLDSKVSERSNATVDVEDQNKNNKTSQQGTKSQIKAEANEPNDKKRLALFENFAAKLQNSLSDHARQLGERDAALCRATEEINRLQSENTNTQQNWDQVRETVREKDQAIQRLKQDVAGHAREKIAMERSLKEVIVKLSQLRGVIVQIGQNEEDLRQNNAKLERRILDSSSHAEDVTGQLDKKTSQIETLTVGLDAARRKISKVESQASSLKRERDEYARQVPQMEQKTLDIQEQNTNLENRLENQKGEMKKKIDAFVKELEAEKDSHKRLLSEHENCNSERRELSRLKIEKNMLEHELDGQKKAYKDLNVQKTDMVDLLKTQISELQARLDFEESYSSEIRNKIRTTSGSDVSVVSNFGGNPYLEIQQDLDRYLTVIRNRD